MKLEKCLTKENMNQNLLNIKYAVRGPVVQRALQIEREIEKGVPKPFERVVRANIGDCQALGQKPITFIRQVLALAACPELMSSPEIPCDVKERVKEILADCTQGTVGAYSPTHGLNIVRERVAQYLSARDGAGAAASPGDVCVGAGASDLVRSVLSLFVQDVNGKPSGVMIPIPQYPLFSGTLAELGLKQVDYYLDEDAQWAIQTEELERSWREASEVCCVRALVVINPGNPTGQVLSLENIEEIIKFAHRRNLFILADEVYQENIICKPFHSFKKVTCEMGAPYCELALASFLTVSKGWAAECGLRAGAAEVRAAADVMGVHGGARALQQCSSVLGQIVLDCVMRPPAPGEPSHARWARERGALASTLRERSREAERYFNTIPGYFCSRIDGSMFAFPRVELPASALEAAARARLTPDQFYCLRLLEETGICVVPGSGFGQRPGSFHFRTTILHTPDEFQHILRSIRDFHLRFLEAYN